MVICFIRKPVTLNKNSGRKSNTSPLRRQAEKALALKAERPSEIPPSEIIHELRVHQIELERLIPFFLSHFNLEFCLS